VKTSIAALLLAVALPGQGYTWADTLQAIRSVETGGLPRHGLGAKGDGGNALGPFQIWRIYHTDARGRDKSLTRYERCLTSLDYSERVVRAYMARYASQALRRLESKRGTLEDVERVSRIHNGGPRGYRKAATLKYWKKVILRLRRNRQQSISLSVNLSLTFPGCTASRRSDPHFPASSVVGGWGSFF